MGDNATDPSKQDGIIQYDHEAANLPPSIAPTNKNSTILEQISSNPFFTGVRDM